ncbi:hypothetical protein ACIOBL_17980 [Paenibacillus taichungensis]|uniref:hypothetical protein n=1 Tax=Paenibacillus TaxID=44249 RepID=UPI0022A99B43|nr:hypothetical protein [Paenibacillus tundrae]MCZ1265967.1 hypothetical protein [Paenibacillus tundrae]
MTSKIGFFEQEKSDDFKRFEIYAKSNVYHIQNTEHYSRIIVWSTNVIDTLIDLVRAMEEPYFILYILNVSRTDQEIARYQSHDLALLDIESFFLEFGDFIENDSRHDIWIHSPSTNSTVVYDKDNSIYIYGDIGKYQELLISKKFSNQIEPIYLPVPHSHQYNSEFDQQEIDILNFTKWYKSPLRPEDY